MSPITIDVYKPQPVWRLTVLFVIACLVFVGIRFDKESFARARIAGAAAASGVDLTFNGIDISGLTLTLKELSLRSGRLPSPVTVDRLSVSPALGALLKGDLQAYVEASWKGIDVEADIARRGASVTLSDIQGAAPAATLLSIAEPYLHLPVQLELGGDVGMEGEMVLSGSNSVPQSGSLQLEWRGARAKAMGLEEEIGELRMHLQSGEGVWNFTLESVDSDLIRGQGAASAAGPVLANWPLSGSAVINLAAVRNPALRALLPKQQGGGTVRLGLSGTLSMPRVDFAN